MKKKIICCLVAFSMIVTMSVPCFARAQEEELAELVTEYSD